MGFASVVSFYSNITYGSLSTESCRATQFEITTTEANRKSDLATRNLPVLVDNIPIPNLAALNNKINPLRLSGFQVDFINPSESLLRST